MHAKKLLCLVVVGLVCGAGSCPAPDPGKDYSFGFDREGMLLHLADEVILPTLRRFDDASASLVTACQAWADESPTTATGTARQAAQQAWAEAMDVWQEAEVMALGPAGLPATADGGGTPGGLGLRDEIYSWPDDNPCGVDQQTVVNAFREEGYFDRRLVDVYGLDALEYLLYVEGADNSCAGASTINSEGQWAALSEAEIWQRRADYCTAAAVHLSRDASRLLEAWEPSGGDFRGELEGGSGSSYANVAEAVDALYAALFYVELMVKDRKVAVPAGLRVLCTAESCPELAESRFARRGKENLLANVRSFQRLFLGRADPDAEDGPGFDDFLAAANARPLAERIATNTETLIGALEAFDGSLQDALVGDVTRVHALHDVIKELTDDLKSQFPAVLALRVPQEGPGDND